MHRYFLLLPLLVVVAGCNEQPHYESIDEITPSFEGFDKEYRELLPFYKEDIAEVKKAAHLFPSARKPERAFLGIDTFDLNEDGIEEVFVWLQSPIACGVNRCNLRIFQKQHDNQYHVIEELIPHAAPLILAKKTNDYYDLAFYDWGNGNAYYNIFKWNGNEYEFSSEIPADTYKILQE